MRLVPRLAICRNHCFLDETAGKEDDIMTIETRDRVLFAQGDAVRLPLADSSMSLVVGSPPYLEQRSYYEDGKDLGIARDCLTWVNWMIRVTTEALRVSQGLVVWVCAAPTRDRNYLPGPEGLVWEWYRRGGLQECPVYWKRDGIPGSGGDQWFKKNIEYCLAFKKKPKLPYADNTACGHPPKCEPGGAMSNRTRNGKRVNAKKITTGGERQKRGEVQYFVQPDLANPGNLLDKGVTGGGNMRSDWAHENEAPYPVDVPEFFIKSFTRPGDLVLDPFSGSGTTVEAASALGRVGVGIDLRASQCRIGIQRIARPHQSVLPSRRINKPCPLFD
jgi:site-specific DNA-methyltransferase (adenine-specific)/site-specific DNA-methyltransferase (cytosine-N4-specific)